MLLDSYSLKTTIFQVQYKDAVEIWDKSGTISRRLKTIWPDLKIVEGRPDSQSLQSRDVHIQTTIEKATVTLKGKTGLDDQRVAKVKETFETWREHLALTVVERISTRAIYQKEYLSIKEANAALLSMNLMKMPAGKVFDQPTDSDKNTVDLRYKFEDEKSFAFVRISTEGVKYDVDLDPEFTSTPEIRSEKFRVLIDFDRGLIGKVDAQKFRVDEWFTGFQHVLRRDLEKVLKA